MIDVTVGFDETTSIIPFWGCCISLFPSTEQLDPVTCELTPSLHALFLPHLLLSSPSLSTLTPSSSLPFPSLERTVAGVTLYKGQRWHVLPANRKCGGSLFADQWQPYVFLWKIQPDNSRIRGRGLCWKKNTALFGLIDLFIHLSGWIFHYLYCYSVRAPESEVSASFFFCIKILLCQSICNSRRSSMRSRQTH